MRPALSGGAILRVVASLVAAERAELGSGRAWDSVGWTAETALGADGLALDSLELLAASEVVARFFRLHESGDENRLLDASTRDGGMQDGGMQDGGTLGGWARVVAASLAGDTTDGFTFATSGTTGLARLCRQSMASLHAEARFWLGELAAARNGARDGGGRVVQTVPAHHIYGFLFTVLLPELADWPVLDARAMTAATLAGALRPGDVLVGHPFGLATLLRGAGDLPRGVRVVSATASLPDETHAALLARGAQTVLDIYGSTETGGIGCRRDAGAAFELLPRWRRADTDALTELATGRTVALPDAVIWDGERRLRPAARRDGAVQVAGVNVFPAIVAARLRTHPLVADAEVHLDTTLPEPRLRATLVATAGASADAVAAAVEKWSRLRFRAPERPVGFDVVGVEAAGE